MKSKKEVLTRLILDIESLDTFIRRMKELRAQWEKEDAILFKEVSDELECH